jgi:hypothetical protein
MQWARWAVMVPVVWLLTAGCGSDPVTREVRGLRLSGQPDSARTLALAALSEHADRRALWLEFARASLDICRLSADESDSSIMETCVQAALLCAAVQQQKSPWGSGWRETGRLVSVQVARQLNRIVASYTTQMQTASMLKDLQQRYPGGAQEYGPIAQTEQQVQGYRDDARRLLTLSVIWRRLLELLPELNPGMSVMYGSELEQRQNQWIEELQLAPGYVGPLQQQARERVDAALARLQEDARDLGYFLVRSVTENGVLP